MTTLPAPVPGLVLRYSFRWSQDRNEEGSKDRSCAILLCSTTRNGHTIVTLLPVTHAPPYNPDLAVEIPRRTKERLGLDASRSWIVLDEANRFIWPGPDLRFLPGTDHVDYGPLPQRLYNLIRDKWLQAYDRRQTQIITRTE